MKLTVEEIAEKIDRISDLVPALDDIVTQGFNVVPYSAKLDEMERLCFDLKHSGYSNVKFFAVKTIDVIKLIQKMGRYGFNNKDRDRLSAAMDKSIKAYGKLPIEGK